MRPFSCSVCGQLLFFHNSTCLRCTSRLGYSPTSLVLDAVVEKVDELPADGASVTLADGSTGRFRWCANRMTALCNWLVPENDDDQLCASCRLTSVRPNDSEVEALVAFTEAEAAKRRLLHQLSGLGLEVLDRRFDEERGVAFEFLSSRNRNVMTGHDGGVITLDLSESDAAHREFVRQQLGEPYRTVLGHLRHEIGHYFWPRLVVDAGRVDEFRALFGDETVSYDDALASHYGSHGDGADDWWVATHVSNYATMHPWEDWAETFAHYLHIVGGLETAESFGVQLGDPVKRAATEAYESDPNVAIGPMIASWLTLTLALNGMSRSIGQDDLYPFVLSATVIEKLDFVHHLVIADRTL